MKKLLIIASLILSGAHLLAQTGSFDLSTYKLPDVKLHLLEAKFNLGGDQANTFTDYENDIHHNSDNLRLDGNVDLLYSFFRNSVKIQSDQRIEVSFAPEKLYGKTEIQDFYPLALYPDSTSLQKYIFENGTFQTATAGNIESMNRFYVQKKWFIESGLGLNARYTGRNNYTAGKFGSDGNSRADINSHNTNIYADIRLGAGFGRIEPVQDARLAVYIFDDLNKNKRLKRTPGNEDIIKFAETISRLKNKRFFDSRIKKIEDIRAVDSFLQANNFADLTDAAYFTLLNDNWDYAFGPERLSGSRVSFGFHPDMVYVDGWEKRKTTTTDLYGTITTITTTSRQIMRQHSLDGYVEFDNEKPISLLWQSSTSIGLELGNYYYQFDTNKVNDMHLDSYASQKFGFYPNTRTSLVMQLNIYYRRSFDKNDNLKYDIISSAGLHLSYYLSPQLRLSVDYDIYYDYLGHNPVDFYDYGHIYKHFNQSLGIGFIYKIL